ncbi:glycosyl hydrolase family 28-related protein [Coraliomargarita sinensis]|uniref:glycosyl hydrolase family 28-related protein n=1 Tax=Coraliomargarita sinensis TaxID=2174842 RepID=UPI0013047E5F|nr:glycosyl hydrolase family 28-related protein [Coraliomargarita sinensis]
MLLFLLLGFALPAQAWRSSLYPDSWTPPENASFDTDPFIQDFSYAGYRSGDESIPNITSPVYNVTDPAYGADPTDANDDTAAIQAAIDDAAAAGGGVIYLPAGTYRVDPGTNDSALRIQDSNIVLRGDGVGQTFILNTSYEMRRKQVLLIKPPSTSFGNEIAITNDLLNPTRRIPVADTSAFSVGDIVRMRWTFTQAWIDEHNQGSYWDASTGETPADAQYLREVLAVDTSAGWIEVDTPTRYSMKTRDNSRVHTIGGMLSHVGLEDFSIGNLQHPGTTWNNGDYNDPTKPAYQVHASWLISAEDTSDSWITGVESYQAPGNTYTCHMLSNGLRLLRCFRVTVADCAMRRSQYGGGGGNGYMYRIQHSHENLIRDSIADFSRHGFVISHGGTSGNVFLRCEDRNTGRSTGSSGSYSTGGSGSDHHMHFSHSNLFDQCHVYNSFFTASHRGNSGTIPHGLSSAHGVYWNTSGEGNNSTIVRSEQGRYGYIIGTSGSQNGASTPTGGNTSPIDILEGVGEGNNLEPQSIYADQVAKRAQGLLLAMEADATVEITSAYPLSPTVYNYESGEPTYSWSQVSGPSTTFEDPFALSTTVALPSEGTYVLELTADNGTTSVSDQITITAVQEIIPPLENTASRVAVDEILGRSQDTNLNPLGYYVDSSNKVVGGTGSNGSRTDSNVVYRYNLPTLPAGEVVSGLSIQFQINAIRDHSGDNYELDVYLLNTADPTTTGTDLFYHGPDDASHAFIGSHYESSPHNNSYTLPDPANVTLTLDSGEALTLLQSYYSGNRPNQTEAALRFNLDRDYGGLGGSALNRYILEDSASVSGLTIRTMPGTLSDWTAAYDLGGLTAPEDDPDADGIPNRIEAFFGTDPSAATGNVADITTDGTVSTFTHPKNLRPPSDLSATYEWSPNLEDWYPGSEGPSGGATVSFDASTSVEGITTVTATASEVLPQLFIRILVQQNTL